MGSIKPVFPTFAERSSMEIDQLLQRQRDFFATGQTRDLQFRHEQLRHLQTAILAYEQRIVAAAKADLGRPTLEAYFEIAVVKEVQLALQQLAKWTKPRQVATAIEVFPAQAWVQPEPLGVVFIMGPWNYPFQLMISPLVGAMAAGNCAVLKPSEYAPQTSALLAALVAETFAPEYVAVVEGDQEMAKALLAERFDHIFFTGGAAVGKLVLAAAAPHLTPVTLELGGKSPCIVDRSAGLDLAAKRIAWGKFINAGQTCVAPDYLLVDRSIKAEFMTHLRGAIQQLYGADPSVSPDFGRIVNKRQFDRLQGLLGERQVATSEKVAIDQVSAAELCYLAPTVVDEVDWEDPLMAEEIFGPILPVLGYEDLGEAIGQINRLPKPLALYIFAQDKAVQKQVVASTASGGVCINDTVVQFSLLSLPFGGVGQSGMGSGHGRASFDTFSHYRSVLKRSMWLDLDWRYAPYSLDKLWKMRRILIGRWFG
jgi:aldehyde dehydrogenase (NAD+)